MDALTNLNPIVQALMATLFTWGMTALGASAVFFTRTVNRKLLDASLGTAAGVMIAASYWSLLAPAIEMAGAAGHPQPWMPAAIGFLAGGGALWIVDKIIPHLHAGLSMANVEGIHTTWRRTTLLVLAITLHNIPEGLAVGVAFGAVAAGLPSATLPAAVALAVGIGLQNLPEGLAVSMPLRGEGMSRRRSFWYGQLSALVEPMAGVVGAAAVLIAQPLLPYALAFAAGAMIFVVVEEVVPEAQGNGNTDIATVGTMLGFALMMVLDVALG
ncbi:MAG: ZIP family metal transporter [Anaerolineae bacterium]